MPLSFSFVRPAFSSVDLEHLDFKAAQRNPHTGQVIGPNDVRKSGFVSHESVTNQRLEHELPFFRIARHLT